MIKDKSIFIKNIYYMLSYAFTTLNQGGYEDVATEEFENIHNLFAAILAKGISRQLKCVDDSISKDAGEYVVSELARETMVSKLDYLDIPLDELVGKKRSGNPGFDFHSQNKITDTVIFGEAKYVATTTAYSSALPQIVDFIRDGKDVEDLPELKPFCTTSALQRAADGRKGFSAAFSAKTTNTDRIIANITKRLDFQSLLQYEELILVAVDL